MNNALKKSLTVLLGLLSNLEAGIVIISPDSGRSEVLITENETLAPFSFSFIGKNASAQMVYPTPNYSHVLIAANVNHPNPQDLPSPTRNELHLAHSVISHYNSYASKFSINCTDALNIIVEVLPPSTYGISFANDVGSAHF